MAFPSSDSKENLNPTERAALEMADQTFAALAKPRREHAVPGSAIRYRDKDIFELVIAGTKVVNYMVSDDHRACLVCHLGAPNAHDAENHMRFCPVRRWLQAVEALKIGLEVI